MKKKDKKKNIKHFLYEDSKKDTFLNPTKWKHLEVWRKMYDLSFKEVITAMQKYYESSTGDKFDHKVAKYTPIKFDKFEESTFLICKVIEDYKYNHPNTSTRQAISNCQKKITELLRLEQ
jgi:hypothetical protein